MWMSSDKQVKVQLAESTANEAPSARARQTGIGEDPAVRIGRLVDLNSEELSLQESSRRSLAIPIRDVRRIQIVDQLKGFRDGVIVGGLVGGLSGAFVALVGTGCKSDYAHQCPSTASSMGSDALWGMLIGGALGAGIGAISGHRTIFKF